MALYLRTAQDPLVMISWRCKKLVELVIYGYVIDAYNLVGISRLRGRGLKKLEVSMTDLSPLAEDTSIFSSFIKVNSFYQINKCVIINCLFNRK